MSIETNTYNVQALHDLGYGDIHGAETIALTAAEVAALAESVGGTVAEIETARI
jgi:hypothetical protein